MSQRNYYPGGTQASEVWDDAASTFTQYAADGTVTAQRPYTAIEVAQAAAAAAAATADSNGSILRARARTLLAALATDRQQVATITSTTGTLTTAQLSNAVRALASVADDLCRGEAAQIRLLLGQLDDISGT